MVGIVIRNILFAQVVDALSLSKATMAKVHQNLAWAVAYNIVAIPIAAGVLLPQFDFAMTPSLSGNVDPGLPYSPKYLCV
jgi:Cu2+-exporting ATPase